MSDVSTRELIDNLEKERNGYRQDYNDTVACLQNERKIAAGIIAERDALRQAVQEAHLALRRHAIARRDRPASLGKFIPNGFHCGDCGADWGGRGEAAMEWHTDGCALARIHDILGG